MANGIKDPELQPQEEISKIVLDKITFNCPHCFKEINETHLDEKGRYFQSIKEKIRRVTEEEVNYQKDIQRKQLLEQLQVERSYEKFAEVIKKNQTIEELTNANKKLEEEVSKVKLNSKEDLAKATSYDEVRKLEGFKELERKVDKYQKENEELKKGNQPEIQILKETIENLKNDITKLKSSEEVEKLERVKELKDKFEKAQEENKEKEKQLSELKSSEYIEKLERVRKLVEETDKLRNENQSLRDQGRMSKRKGENLEKYVLEKLQETYNGTDEISKITHIGEKADIIHEISKDNQPIAKIIYEIKNDDK